MAGTRQILIVDDNRALRPALALALETMGGFSIRLAGDAEGAMALAVSRAQHFAALRDHGVRVPIVLVTAASAEEDVVRGLDAGANDYVVKPFRLAEIVARLRAQIRAFESSEDAVLLIGPYHFRPGSRTLTAPVSNREIRLTDKEAAVLKHLYRAGRTPVSRQTLLREIWGYATAASTHTVETHIYRLRRKIEPDAAAARILVNVEGGYRLAHERGAAIEMAFRPRRAPPHPALAAAE